MDAFGIRSVLASLAVAATLGAGGALAQTLTIGQATPPTSLDPHFHRHSQNAANATHVFDTLFLRNARMQLEPGLAVSARALNDTTWEFKLREGVTFHDGSPFTSDDVAFTFRRAPSVPNSLGSYGSFFRDVAGVTIVDPMTFRVQTRGPAPLIVGDLSNIFIISRKHGENATTDDYNSGRAMIGTGPYRFAAYQPGVHVTYARNDSYWRVREPWERAVFRIIPNNAARVAALLAGDVDVIADLPTTDVERLRSDPRLSVFTIAANRLVFLTMDITGEALKTGHISGPNGEALPRNPLDDRRVRQALSMAINREGLVNQINQGQAVLTGQYVPEGFFGYVPDLAPERFDPEGARRLLAEAGWGGGFRITLATSNDRIINSARMVQAIAQMWQRIGVQTNVELMPHAVFSRRRENFELPMFMSSWGNDTGEALSTLVPQIGTRDRNRGLGSANRVRYSNAEFDNLLMLASRELNEEKRFDLIVRATRMAREEAVMQPVLLQVNNWGARKGIRYDARIDQYTLAMSARRE
ncbi:MAG: ABC transporter substrate-binding protein [Alphaproteobacteria bacterium]|nr:ABC transporter substrate-binding protein [Alphaproteobacteria bacterium]